MIVVDSVRHLSSGEFGSRECLRKYLEINNTFLVSKKHVNVGTSEKGILMKLIFVVPYFI